MFAIRKNTTARHIYILHATSICLAAAIYLCPLLGLHIEGDEAHTIDIFHDGLTIIFLLQMQTVKATVIEDKAKDDN